MQKEKNIADRVFLPAKLAGISLSNRIIRSATNEGYGDDSGRPRPELADFHARLAKGGAGAIITGFSCVGEGSRGINHQTMIHKDEFIPDYRKIADRVHALGTPIIMQLAHAGRQTSRAVAGARPVAPSAIRDKVFITLPRALSTPEIERIVSDFAAAAVRAKEAGFDGIQLHAAHGYLLSQFLSPYMNRRKDEWGGSLENRFRIIRRIIEECRKAVGYFPILAKINASDTRKNGMRPGMALEVARLLEQAGCDGVEVSCGVVEDGFNTVRVPRIPTEAMLEMTDELRKLPGPLKKVVGWAIPHFAARLEPLENFNVEDAALIKKKVGIPVIVVGGIRRLADIRKIIEDGSADFVAMARPFIIEPDLVMKFASGKSVESRCINCGYCLLGINRSPVRCYYGKLPKR